ncbi:MAG TPA: GerMN domain-containing protein [Candidatus Portnoybacteria bacterium]|nr:GerMN domain-containing protein [Candidatus Portnoybacteria bacterium]
MSKKAIILLIILLVLIVGIVSIVAFLLKNEAKNFNSDITVSVKSNQVITSPLQIDGKARGFWFFEASFPIKLVDENNNILAITIAQAKEDPVTGDVNWMTEDFVDFEAKLEFVPEKNQKGFLIFMRDNPSGLPENNEEFKVPVQMEAVETTIVKVFFNNNQMDPEMSCNKVFPIERTIKKTEAVGRVAIEELLKGPLETEETQGFFTSINSGVKIQSLIIENGTAKIDFDEQLQFQVGGSCRVSAIRAQIIETLKQFSTVKNVIISINGRTEEILQP